MTKYYSTKKYGNDRGYSCCFRQWRAGHSHCKYLHGYSMGFKLQFERNWVMDFGGLKPFKAWLDETFDHQTIVAADDPELETFKKLEQQGLCQLKIVEGVGCEMFAKMAFEKMSELLQDYTHNKTLRLVSAEAFEHESNSAICRADDYVHEAPDGAFKPMKMTEIGANSE